MKNIELSDREKCVLQVALNTVEAQQSRNTQAIWSSLAAHFKSAISDYSDITHKMLSPRTDIVQMSPVKLAFRIQSAQILHGNNTITREHAFNPHTLPDKFEDTLEMALRVFSNGNPEYTPNSKQYWIEFTKFVNDMNGNIKFESVRAAKDCYERLLRDRVDPNGRVKTAVAKTKDIDLSRLATQRAVLLERKKHQEDGKRAPRQNLRTGKPTHPYHGRRGPKDPDLL